MTLSIICAFIGCWTPYFVVHLIHIWTEYRYNIADSVYAFAETLALLNSAINPILYGCFNVQLKRSLAELCCHGTRGSPSTHRPLATSPSRVSHTARNGREMVTMSDRSDAYRARSRSEKDGKVIILTRTLNSNSYQTGLSACAQYIVATTNSYPAAPTCCHRPVAVGEASCSGSGSGR